MSGEKKTLRDEFAMAALNGFIANSEGVHSGAEPIMAYLSNGGNAAWLAECAFKVADAMMAARALGQGGEK